jgi:hypothetical protein
MSLRYLLLVVIAIYVVVVLFVPAMQSVFGYGFGTLLALVVLYFFLAGGRERL